MPAASAARRLKYGRHAFWLLSIFVVVAAVGVAWSILHHEPPEIVASSPVTSVRNTAPLATLETSPDDSKVNPMPGPARLEIPEPEFDFGYVPQYAKISHVFWLYSSGIDTLKILRVNPG